MATTEHILKLKAVLDSKQVQQELQRLRQQSQALIGQSRQQGINSPSSSAANLGNLNSLGTAMTRLAQMIQNLDHTMSQMNNMSKMSINKSRQSGSPIAMSLGGSVASNIGKSLEEYNNKALRTFLGKIRGMGDKTQVREIAKTVWTEKSRVGQLIRQNFGIDDTQQFSAQFAAKRAQDVSFKTLNRQFGSIASFSKSRLGLEYINYDPYEAEKKAEALNNHKMMKFMGGMMLNQVAGSAADYYEATGNVGVAGGIGAASKVGGYALMGASVGGPWGALAGAGIGAIESLFDTFTAKAREAKEELDREWRIEQSLKTGTTEFLKGRKDYQKNKSYEDAFESLSEEYNTEPLSKQIDSLTQRREFVRSRLDVFENMSSRGFLGEQDLKSAKEMQQELVELDNKIKNSTNALKNYRQAFDNLKEADTYQESTRKLFKTGSLADIQSAYEKIKTKRDEAMASGNLRDIQKYNPRMRSYEQQIERIREVQTQSSLELQRMDESYENTRVLERYGIGGGRGLRSTLMGYARKAAGERSRYEQLMKEGKLEEASKAKESWQSAARERNSLADQLLQVLGNRTADLTNVTSLAQMGFGMGEKNDNYDRQMKVWEDQRNLQREIKNILNEKTFVATYGE